MRLVILTGASGSGKTAIAEAIASRYPGLVDVHHFDHVGVPPVERMIAQYGSPEEWQRAMTFEWMVRLAAIPDKGRLLFEGQMRPSFVVSAAGAAGITEYRLILVDCDDATRSKRLVVDRGSPELANATMMDWANHLREEARRLPCRILDTTRASLVSCVDEVWRQLDSAVGPIS